MTVAVLSASFEAEQFATALNLVGGFKKIWTRGPINTGREKSIPETPVIP